MVKHEAGGSPWTGEHRHLVLFGLRAEGPKSMVSNGRLVFSNSKDSLVFNALARTVSVEDWYVSSMLPASPSNGDGKGR